MSASPVVVRRTTAAEWGDLRAVRLAMLLDTPRAFGSTPAATNASSAAAPLPAHPDSAARSVLRRWAKAASTTAKTCSRVALVGGGSRRTSETSPESTLGTGQKTLRGTRPASSTRAHQAALTLGTP